MEHLKIKKVKKEDIDSLLRLSIETFTIAFGPPVNTSENFQLYMDKSFTKEKLQNEFENPDSAFYFAMLYNKPIGYLKINTGHAQTELKESNSLEIERIYVVQEYQSQKIGQLLFEYAVKMAKEQDKDFLWLGVWEHNTRAIRFYEKKGMAEFNRHLFDLGGDIQTDIMMKLKL